MPEEVVSLRKILAILLVHTRLGYSIGARPPAGGAEWAVNEVLAESVCMTPVRAQRVRERTRLQAIVFLEPYAGSLSACEKLTWVTASSRVQASIFLLVDERQVF